MSSENIPVSVYPFDAIDLHLPIHHKMPNIKAACKLLDSFLPHVVSYIDAPGTIIDIGANCGDTLAAMYSTNKDLKYVCVEPDNTFFVFLEHNAQRIRGKYGVNNITSVQAMIGSEIKCAVLAQDGTTATYGDINCETSEGAIETKSLDSIVESMNIRDVKLLKVDTDYYDYDVLNSSKLLLTSQRPMIYFECCYLENKEPQIQGYKEVIRYLESVNYRAWAIFDNFGELLLRTDSTDTIMQLIDYVWRLNTGRSLRTIYYYDIFTFQDVDAGLANTALDDYAAGRIVSPSPKS